MMKVINYLSTLVIPSLLLMAFNEGYAGVPVLLLLWAFSMTLRYIDQCRQDPDIKANKSLFWIFLFIEDSMTSCQVGGGAIILGDYPNAQLCFTYALIASVSVYLYIRAYNLKSPLTI